MRHIYSNFDFSLESIPISIGEFSRVFKFATGDVGRIFQYMTPLLYNTPNVRAGKFWFTLVNVSSSHTEVSYGILPKPNDAMLPLTTVWDFTFALTPHGYSEHDVSTSILSPSLNARSWRVGDGRFLTIGLTHAQSQDFGLRSDVLTPKGLYYVLGAMTKSFVLHSGRIVQSYDFLNGSRFPEYYRRWFMRPIYAMLRGADVSMLAYNRFVWSEYTSLLSENHITPNVLLYVILYTRSIARLPKTVENIVLDLLQSSLTNFIQAKDGGATLDDEASLLYPMLALKQESIPLPTEGFTEFVQQHMSNVPIPATHFETYLRKLFYA